MEKKKKKQQICLDRLFACREAGAATLWLKSVISYQLLDNLLLVREVFCWAPFHLGNMGVASLHAPVQEETGAAQLEPADRCYTQHWPYPPCRGRNAGQGSTAGRAECLCTENVKYGTTKNQYLEKLRERIENHCLEPVRHKVQTQFIFEIRFLNSSRLLFSQLLYPGLFFPPADLAANKSSRQQCCYLSL